MSYPSDAGYLGARDVHSDNTDLDAHSFLIRRILDTVAGSALVQVQAVTNAGGLAAVGFVDVQPMVHQIDGAGNATPHGIVHHLPYFRLQGGANAIILDPQVGDIGIAVFADRDISSVKSSRKPANPGSRRKSSMADGLYIGGVLNGLPVQFIAFASTGISITTPQKLTLSAANVTLDASGNFGVTGAVVGGVGGADQVTLQGHRHGTGTAAAGTVAPTAGT